MPIVIMPKQSKMDKMGGGGMDIGRTPPSPSKYAIPGIEKNPTLKKKKMKMSGKMEDMREYLNALDGIEEEMHSAGDKLGKDFFRKIAMSDSPYDEIEKLLTADGLAGDVIRDQFDNTAADEGLVPDDNFEEILDMMVQNFEDMTLEDTSEDTIEEGAVKDMMQDVEEGMSKAEFEKAYPGMGDKYDEIKKEIMDRQDENVKVEVKNEESQIDEGGQSKHEFIRALFKSHFGQPDYNETTGGRSGMRRLKIITGTTRGTGYEFANDGPGQDTSDFEREIGKAGLSGDVRVKSTGKAITVLYPDAFRMQSVTEADYSAKKAHAGKDIGKKDVEDGKIKLGEGGMKQASIEVEDWAEKYNKFTGVNGDELANGYLQATLNTGIMSDAYDQDEYIAFNEKNGYEDDGDWQEGDMEKFMMSSPNTKGMFDEIEAIQKKYGIDEEGVDDIMGYFDKKQSNMENKDIEVEEDCGCDQEAVDAMVSVPVQELQDILQLAGYENYAEKIAEYANEPAEEYSNPEDQLIGLSGGLNRPKKSYPASAPGDNPMDQEPREVEETMEAVEEKLYKSYKDFLEEVQDAK